MLFTTVFPAKGFVKKSGGKMVVACLILTRLTIEFGNCLNYTSRRSHPGEGTIDYTSY